MPADEGKKVLQMRRATPARSGMRGQSRALAALGSTLGLAPCLSGCKGVLDPQGPVGLTILFLGGMTWVATHELDPARPLASERKSLVIEVVSLDWKWLFIYPEQGVATVNRLVVPAETPLSFRLTSASVMNSFFVPQLGSQIYTMAGMETRLNLQADRPGTYAGLSAQFSGGGFSGMHFDVVAQEPAAFESWASRLRAQGGTLDRAGYEALAKPSKAEPPREFGSVAPNLFDQILNTWMSQSAALLCAPPRQAAEQRGDK